MKHIYPILAGLLILLSLQVSAQAPNSLNYQGVARDASGNALTNATVNLRFTIHQTSESGTTVYQETQLAITNQFGLFTVAIGTGTIISGNFSTIAWGTDAFYLQIEMDPTGGTNYINMGTNQFLSVPYALYAATAGNAGSSYIAGTGIGITGSVISAKNADALWNANKLQGDSISITAPTSGQVLEWNGVAWAPATAATSGWNLTGNSGTKAGTNFIGTTDANDLVFKTNNVEDMRISNSNGYVGIGTNSPAQELHVDATQNNGSDFGAYNMVVEIEESNASGNMSGLYLNGSTNPNNQLAGIVTRGGNSEAFYQGLNNNWDYRIAGMNTIDQTGLTNAKDGSAGMTILNSNGNVGIGTTSPAQLLHVVDVNNTGSDFGGYNFEIEVESQSGTNAGIYINGSTSANGLAGLVESSYSTAFYSGLNNNADYRIAGVAGIDATDLTNAKDGTAGITVSESTGNVGIGTNSPAQTLDVEGGNLQFSQALMPAGNAGTAGQVLQSNGANSVPTWVTFSSSGTPAWNLIGNTSTVYGVNFVGNTDDQSLMFEVNSTVSGRIEDNNSGNNAYQNTSLGYAALQNISGSGGGTGNDALGYNAGMNTTIGSNNIAIGTYALVGNTTGSANVAIGLFAIDGENGTTTGSNNTAVGVGAQYSGSGNNNTSLGSNAGHGIVNSSSNVSVGYEALAGSMSNGNDPGSQNVAVGSYALYNNSSAGQNVAIGDSSLASNSSGTPLTAIGYQTLASDNSTTNDLAIGYMAMSNYGNNVSNTHQNVAIGDYTLNGGSYSNEYVNTAVGYQALQNNETYYNTGIGGEALNQNTSGAYNTAIGADAALSNTTGNSNSALGVDALATNTTGSNNTAIGYQVMELNNEASDNVAVGYQTLYNNDNDDDGNGQYNSAVGYQASYNNIDGYDNTSMGYSALYYNYNATDNTAVGYNAMYNNDNDESSSAEFNIAVGSQAYYHNIDGNQSVAIGYSALYNNQYAINNTAVGYEALYNNDNDGSNSAWYNTAIGNNAMYNNVDGQWNTAIGDIALQDNTSGTKNVALGTSLESNTTGSYNVAAGQDALSGNTDGSYNTAIGVQAGNQSDASDNTSVGYNTLQSNNSGSNLTVLGYQANVSTDGLSNATAIGANATVSASNLVQLGSGCSVQFDQALMPGGDPGTSGYILQSNGANNAPTWVAAASATIAAEQLLTPTTGATINAIVGTNIVNPAGSLATLTIALPSSPSNGQCVEFKFTQNVTTITYSGGTVAASVATSVGVGFDVRLFYDAGTSTWY